MLSRSMLFSSVNDCTQQPGTNAHLLAQDMEQKRFDFLNLERRSTLPQNSHFSSSPFGPGGRGTNSRSEACFFSDKKQNMSQCSSHYSQRFASHHKQSILLPIKLLICTNTNQSTSSKVISRVSTVTFPPFTFHKKLPSEKIVHRSIFFLVK